MIEQYIGISTDYIVIGLAAVVLILLILLIVNMVQTSKLKKKYNLFMGGRDAKALEEVISERIEQIDKLESDVKNHERDLHDIFKNLKTVFQKFGLVKYDAFSEMGGKLSFSLCLLDENNNGYILNAMHTREGCYTYVKEIINGNSIIQLAEEEQNALMQALDGE